jgi:hypothetical protein
MTAPNNIQCAGVTAVKARLFVPWRGQWTLDVDLDPAQPATVASVPSGQVTTTIGNTVTLVGTVDPRLSGRFAAAVRARIVAGGAGWDRHVPAQDFQSSGGVSSLAVENATASLVGETVNDPQPVSLGLRWERMADAASTIFSNPDRDWYVDASGVTQVGSWPSATPDPTVEVLAYDPGRQTVTLSATALVLPGTVLTDSATPPRWDGGLTIRDIEITWTADGMRATAWLGQSPAPRIAGMLKSMVAAFGHLDSLKRWVYTVVSLGSGNSTLNLQATPNANGTASRAPNLSNCPVLPSTAGLSCKPALGSRCHVVFLSDGWSDPIVTSFDQTLPASATYDTTGRLALGPSAAGVDLCGGGPGVAGQGDTILAYLPPEVPFSAVLGAVPLTGVMTIPGPLIGVVQTASSTVTRANMVVWPVLLYVAYREAGPWIVGAWCALVAAFFAFDFLRRRRWAR